MIRLLLIIALTFLLSMASAQAEATRGTIKHDDLTRTYRLFVPSGYDGFTPVPLVIALHPSGGDGDDMAAISGFDTIAERESFLVLYPEGPYGYWDYGAGLPRWTDVPGILDDPGYIAAVTDLVTTAYAVDPARIYAAGYSNGARMAFRLGCDMGDRLAAIATVAATISDEITTACPSDAYVSALIIHGTTDNVIPWYGKRLHIDNYFISNALSSPRTAQFWADQNGCLPVPEISTQDIQPAPGDRRSLRIDHYIPCDANTEVTFVQVINGRHQWDLPGIDTGELIWSFFLRQTL